MVMCRKIQIQLQYNSDNTQSVIEFKRVSSFNLRYSHTLKDGFADGRRNDDGDDDEDD